MQDMESGTAVHCSSSCQGWMKVSVCPYSQLKWQQLWSCLIVDTFVACYESSFGNRRQYRWLEWVILHMTKPKFSLFCSLFSEGLWTGDVFWAASSMTAFGLTLKPLKYLGQGGLPCQTTSEHCITQPIPAHHWSDLRTIILAIESAGLAGSEWLETTWWGGLVEWYIFLWYGKVQCRPSPDCLIERSKKNLVWWPIKCIAWRLCRFCSVLFWFFSFFLLWLVKLTDDLCHKVWYLESWLSWNPVLVAKVVPQYRWLPCVWKQQCVSDVG